MNAHLLRARLLMQRARYDLAEGELRQALVTESSSGEAHALLACCLAELDSLTEATQEAELAIVNDPEEPFGHYALSFVMLHRKRLPEARRRINEAIRLDPWNASHFALLARIEQRANDWNACLRAAERGLEQDPDAVACSNLRSIALTSLGRHEESAQSVHSVLRRNPDDPDSHANEGWRLLHLRQPEQAMKHFQEALRLDPTSEYARNGIVEAMKSRHFVYRWLFSFLLWMNRFTPRVQLLLVVGILFGQRILVAAMSAVPVLEPFSPLIVAAYLLFVWITWSGSALFDLVLLSSRFGSLALTDERKLLARLTGGAILLSVFAMALYWQPSGWRVGQVRGVSRTVSALLFLGLTFPLIATFQQERTRRVVAIAWTTGVFLLCIWANVVEFRLPERLSTELSRSLSESHREKARSLAANESDWIFLDIDDLASDELDRTELRRRMGLLIQPISEHANSIFLTAFYSIGLSTWLGIALAMIPQRK